MSEETIEEAKRLVAEGVPREEAARILNVPGSTLRNRGVGTRYPKRREG